MKKLSKEQKQYRDSTKGYRATAPDGCIELIQCYESAYCWRCRLKIPKGDVCHWSKFSRKVHHMACP
jgi:hypothetical protein